MHPLASGLAGAVVLTAIHEAARRLIADAPRMDIVGMRAVSRLYGLAGRQPPGPAQLYRITMAGDLISNGLYYSAISAGSPVAVWPRAVTLGLAAGLGAIALPRPLQLGCPPHHDRPRTRVLTIAWYVTGALVAAAFASRNGHPRPDASGGLETLRDLTDGIDVAMLTTIGARGRIHSRPMMAQRIGDDGTIWFFTRAESGKAHEIEAHPEVNVAYADSGDQRYVSIEGRGRLIRDREKARELWNPAWRTWFPEGLQDPDLALIAVSIDSVEYWDSQSSTMIHLGGLPSGRAGVLR